MTATHREFLVEGPRAYAPGYVRGYLKGRGHEAAVVDLEHEGFDCEPLRERLSELLHRDRDVSHLVVPEGSAAAFRDAVRETSGSTTPLAIVSELPVSRAKFEFSVEVFSPQVASRVRALFSPLPPGVVSEPAAPFVETHFEPQTGTGVYAPVHPYELRGSGTVSGPFEGVLDLWRRCRGEKAVRLEPARARGPAESPAE